MRSPAANASGLTKTGAAMMLHINARKSRRFLHKNQDKEKYRLSH
jgi:hypothetical protein